MKKILFVSKFFSGFENIILTKTFNPTGAPTAYKIIQSLEKQYNLKVIFTSKNDLENNSLNKSKKYKINNFKNKIIVLKSLHIFKLKKISFLFTEFYQFIYIFLYVLFWRPQIIYFGNANIISAALTARFMKRKIIFRIMGVYDVMRSYHDKKKLKDYFYLWCYRSNFDLSIITQDGSGVEQWISKSINKNTKCLTYINGVDLINYEKFKSNKNTKVNILFVGRLEKPKGIIEFLKVVDKLYTNYNSKFKFTVVGSGLYEVLLKQYVDRYETNYFSYVSRLSHKEINKIYKVNDIYISLNKRGSLSNTTLEALYNGLYCFCLSSDKLSGIDIYTDMCISNKIIKRINRNDIINDLYYNLINLDKNQIPNQKNISKNFAKNFIPSWDKRINDEINLIKKLF